MEYSPILVPVIALVAWTLVVFIWMLATRGAAFRRMGVTLSNMPKGARGVDLDSRRGGGGAVESHNTII